MKNVMITINRFGGSNRVLVDGVPVDADSGIYDVLKYPAAKMLVHLFGEIQRECFGEYKLTVTTDAALFQVISRFGDKGDYCRSVKEQKPPVNLSFSERCRKINEIWGAELEAIPVSITVFLSEEMMKNAAIMRVMAGLKSSLQAAYPLLQIAVKGASYNRYTADREHFSLVLIDRREHIRAVKEELREAAGMISDTTVCLCLTESGSIEWQQTAPLLGMVPEAKLADAIQTAFEAAAMPGEYNRICRQIFEKTKAGKISSGGNRKQMFRYLQSLEGVYQIVCPIQKMEVGEKHEFRVEAMPKRERMPELEFFYSMHGIVECKNGSVTALNAGETDVAVHIKGDRVPLGKLHFTVQYIPRVQNIEALNPAISMKVGERASLKYKITPADASDRGSIKVSISGEAASLQKGNVITARQGGKTEIVMTARNGASAKWEISVQDKVREIVLLDPDSGAEITEIHCRTSDVIRLKVQSRPEKAWNPALHYLISESDSDVPLLEDRLAAKELRNGDILTLKAKCFGSGTLNIWSETEPGKKDLQKQCRIEIEKGALAEKSDISIVSVILLILFIIIIICMCAS